MAFCRAPSFLAQEMYFFCFNAMGKVLRKYHWVSYENESLEETQNGAAEFNARGRHGIKFEVRHE